MQWISSARHTSYKTERTSDFNVIKTVGADAGTGSSESSRKHKYKIAVIQECLGASWQQGNKGSSQRRTEIRHPGKVWIYESHQPQKKPETWLSLTITTTCRFSPVEIIHGSTYSHYSQFFQLRVQEKSSLSELALYGALSPQDPHHSWGRGGIPLSRPTYN